MNALRIFLGVLFAFVALFAGGCSLAFTIMAIMDWSNEMLGLLIVPAMGFAVAFGTSWLAWRFFKAPPPGGAPPGDAG